MELRKIKPTNKKGQILNTIGGTVMSLMILIFIVFAVLFGVATLNPSGFFTADSAEDNATTHLQGNLTTGVEEIGEQLPNVFKILAVVLVIGGIVLLIFYVARMRGVGGSSNTGL